MAGFTYDLGPAGLTSNGYGFYGYNSLTGLYGSMRPLGEVSTQTTVISTPVTPVFDPKIDANALYGKRMALFVGGSARIGASPAPLVGPIKEKLDAGLCDFIVSFGVPANVDGDRKIYAIYLDNELAWSSTGGGTVPADGTFSGEPFDFVFKPGTLTQTVCSLETTHFPGDENAYRPQMILEITNLPTSRFIANTNKPVPYVACDIGDVTDGADPSDGINLGEALERVAYSPWLKYTSSTFEAIDVDEVVDAGLFKDNFTIIQLCQSTTSEYRNLDLLTSDKIRVKDRASVVTPDFIFDRDAIIGGDNPISVARTGATAQKREHELIAIDPDQDYMPVPSLAQVPREPFVVSGAVGKDTNTLPWVIDANTRQALATLSQNYQENARRRISFKVGPSGYQIEPGDLFRPSNLNVDGVADEIFKCVETSHNADWSVDVVGESVLYCSIVDGAVDGTFIGFHEASGTNSTYNFGSCDIGTAAADRLVVVVATNTKSISPRRAVTAVTIGGNAATIHASAEEGDAGVSANPSMGIAIASLLVPTGTAATITISTAGNVDGACIAVYALYGLVSNTPFDTASDTDPSGGNPTLGLDVPAGGFIIAGYGAMGGTLGSASWTGLNSTDQNETFPGPSAWSSGATQSGLGAQSGRTITVSSSSSGPEVLIAASFS